MGRGGAVRGLFGSAGLLLMMLLILPAMVRAEVPERLQVSRLLVTLPDSCPTPDAMAIDAEGNLVVSCPNFADPEQPPCFIKITPELEVKHWFTAPTFAETGRAAPMGFAFGPDGDLYVADNQNWATGNGEHGEINQGRLLRLRVRNGEVVRKTVVAHSISHPNVVAATSMSRCSLYPAFKHYVGRTICQELKRKRVEQAQHLLLSTSDKVVRIAHQCGLPSSEQFCRTFVRVTGTTPTAFRKAGSSPG